MNENTDSLKQLNNANVPQSSLSRIFGYFAPFTAVYALFYSFCLYKNLSGITSPFFVAGTLCYFLYCFKKLGVPLKKDSVFYMAATLLLGTANCLTDNVTLIVFSHAGILMLFATFLLHTFYADEHWTVTKQTVAFLQWSIEALMQLGAPVTDGQQYKTNKRGESKGVGGYILIGVICCVPIIIIILPLLASADSVFSNLINIVNFKSIFDAIRPLTLSAFIFFAAYCAISALTRRKVSDKVLNHRQGEPVIVITMLTMISVIYLLFCAVQINSLFLGSLPAGVTYATYARSGFFQLLTVCAMNLMFVLWCVEFFREHKFLKAALTVVGVCTYVMLASSFYRMFLYIEVYDLTPLRFYVIWALITIAVLLAGLMIMVYKKNFPLFRYSVFVITVMYILLIFVRPDYQIAKYNINAMAEREGNANDDFTMLSQLSADAAPALLKAFSDEDIKDALSKPYNDDYSAEKACLRIYVNKIKAHSREINFRNFNFSRYEAERLLGVRKS